MRSNLGKRCPVSGPENTYLSPDGQRQYIVALLTEALIIRIIGRLNVWRRIGCNTREYLSNDSPKNQFER
jgi:hypothetical protein